jgi:hypothetical protein
MARTYYIAAPPPSSSTHIRYTPHELRCLAALFTLASQPRSFRRWLLTRWWVLLSSERVIWHIRTCTAREYRILQRRQARAVRLAALRS